MCARISFLEVHKPGSNQLDSRSFERGFPLTTKQGIYSDAIGMFSMLPRTMQEQGAQHADGMLCSRGCRAEHDAICC